MLWIFVAKIIGASPMIIRKILRIVFITIKITFDAIINIGPAVIYLSVYLIIFSFYSKNGGIVNTIVLPIIPGVIILALILLLFMLLTHFFDRISGVNNMFVAATFIKCNYKLYNNLMQKSNSFRKIVFIISDFVVIFLAVIIAILITKLFWTVIIPVVVLQILKIIEIIKYDNICINVPKLFRWLEYTNTSKFEGVGTFISYKGTFYACEHCGCINLVNGEKRYEEYNRREYDNYEERYVGTISDGEGNSMKLYADAYAGTTKYVDYKVYADCICTCCEKTTADVFLKEGSDSLNRFYEKKYGKKHRY